MLFFNSLIDFTVEKFKNASLLDSGLEFSRKVFGDGLRAAILLLGNIRLYVNPTQYKITTFFY